MIDDTLTAAVARLLADANEEPAHTPWSRDVRTVLSALEAAQADARRYADALFSLGAMRDPPCFFCGYDGPGYFQPNHHPCARRHHAAIAAAMKGEGDA